SERSFFVTFVFFVPVRRRRILRAPPTQVKRDFSFAYLHIKFYCMKRTIIVFLLLFSLPVFSQTDTLISSVNLITGYNDSASNFFHRNAKLDAARWAETKLTTRTRKTTTLKTILSDPERRLPEHVIADLDNDGKKELVISSHTGGAH